ncbi:Transcriptional regulator [Lachancea thermotolerans]
MENMEIPQRQLTKEEINRCYLRWQQLRNEHGENAANVPEYVYFTKVLQVAAKQQQKRQQEQQQGQQSHHQLQQRAPQQAPQQQQLPPQPQQPQQSQQTQAFQQIPQAHMQQSKVMPQMQAAHMPQAQQQWAPQSTNGHAAMANSQPPQDHHIRTSMGQSPQQTQPPQPVQMPQQAHVQNMPSQTPPTGTGVPSSIFTPEQSELLKAQIASLKFLLGRQPIPPEVQEVIQRSLNNPPDFKQMLLSLSETVKKRQNPQQEQVLQNPQQEHTQQPPRRVVDQQQPLAHQSPHTSNSGVPTPLASQFPPSQPETGLASRANSGSGTANPEKGAESVKTEPIAEIGRPAQDTQPLKEVPPVPLEEFKRLNPDVEKIVNVTTPNMVVDSYSLPNFPDTAVEYKELFPSKDRPRVMLQPGVLPPGIDVHSALEIYQTLIALDIDTAVDSCLSDTLNEDADVETKKRATYDYYALQLLPLQKAMRGHVLQFDWYQKALLTNTHPNFLSKIRRINLQDALLTDELYRRYEIMQYERQRYEESTKLKSITDSSIEYYNAKLNRRTQRVKFGHRLISLHGNIEKEEQKRMERNAKQRLQALKANDEEAYIKLLDQTKDTRITHLLKQTNAFLDSLTKAVRSQQQYTKEKIDSHMQKEEESATPQSPSAGDVSDEEERQNIDYYNVAHRIKEEIKQQPSILVGGTLKEYQLKGLQWMVSLYNNHLNGILADEMGLGKTIQTISLLTYLYEAKNVRGPSLVIVPLSTLTNWDSEFDKWAPVIRKVAYKGSPNERKSKQGIIRSGQFDVVLTTFEYIIKERALLSKIKWVHMIIDEGHRMKNAQSKLSLTLNNYYHTDYRLILTGTPLQNNLPELWALLNFVLPKIFNSVKSFDEWFNTPFANTGGQDKIELSEEETLLVIRRLHKVLRPFLLRRLKKDVEKELPDKVEKVLKCKMSALQQKLYEQMLKHRRLFIGDINSNKMVGMRGFNNQIMQLKKICNHPFVFEDVEDQINPTRETNANIWRVAGKFELLERILPKFKATGHRILIFFQMTQIMDIMEDFLRLSGMKYLRLDGHTKSDDRTLLLNLFNDPNSEYFCFLLSTRAGGLGLNLQTADTVIIFDTDWNPHQDLQAQDRAHRIGQKNEVRILRLITENSVEEVILDRAHKKLDIDGKVIQAGKFDNKSTSEEQEALLRSLLEAEEEQKKKRALGMEEEEQMDDNELNETLARSEEELKIFAQIDEERSRTHLENGITTSLMESSELPNFYHQDIEAELDKKENDELLSGGRGTRERKSAIYEDDIPEEQWLKQFEISDGEDEPVSGPKKREASETRVPEKRAKLETEEPSELDVKEEANEKLPPPEAGQTSMKSTKGVKGRPRGRSRGSRINGKAKNGRNFVRDPDSVTESKEVREEVAAKAKQLHDFAVAYRDADDRRLADIFLVKPSRKLYPDYYLLIKYPVALETVLKHIETLAYGSLKDALDDFHLIFANARVYNTEESLIYHDSIELENAIIEKYKEMTGEEKVDFTEFDEEHASQPLVPIGNAESKESSPAPQ